MFLLPKVEAVNKAKLKLLKMYYNFESSRYYINTVQILINFTFEKSLDMIIPMEKNKIKDFQQNGNSFQYSKCS